MELLSDFQVTGRTRVVWHSEKDRLEWQPFIAQANDAFSKAELDSVGLLRPAAQVWVERDDLFNLQEWARRKELYLKVRRWTARQDGFAHAYLPGNDQAVVLVATQEHIVEDPYPESWFGYPLCCHEFFCTHFPRIIDPVWQWAESDPGNSAMAIGSGGPSMREKHVDYTGLANPCLRYVGVRWVPWIPCQPNCPKTLDLGNGWGELLRYEGLDTDRLFSLLNARMTWDVYRGQAIVTTPWFRIVTPSVPTRVRHLVSMNPKTATLSLKNGSTINFVSKAGLDNSPYVGNMEVGEGVVES